MPGNVSFVCMNSSRLLSRSPLPSSCQDTWGSICLGSDQGHLEQKRALSWPLLILPVELGSHSDCATVSSPFTGAHADMSGLSCKVVHSLREAVRSIAHSRYLAESCSMNESSILPASLYSASSWPSSLQHGTRVSIPPM